MRNFLNLPQGRFGAKGKRWSPRRAFMMLVPGSGQRWKTAFKTPMIASEVPLMNSMVDSLFDQYDRGGMTRRHLVQALAALVLPTAALAQDGARASGPIVRGLSVNHVAD